MSNIILVKSDPTCIVDLDCLLSGLRFLSSQACPLHPGMTQLPCFLSAAVKSSSMQGARTALALFLGAKASLTKEDCFSSYCSWTINYNVAPMQSLK